MRLLESVSSPEQLKELSPAQLRDLAAEIREFLVSKVSATGGHLGPNLGVVELSIAVHCVFDSPKDPIIWDTSHQSYVHKILTGRAEGFDNLRQKDGLSGYTCRAESEHDWTESSHASASISVAEGLSRAFKIKGEDDRCVVAIVGDGALTGGMCWEALNNLAADKDRNAVIIVNDNGRSYAPTIGGFAENLKALRAKPSYDWVMDKGKTTLNSMGWFGKRTFEGIKSLKAGVRTTVVPTELFPELGIKYIGPVDGHDLEDLLSALEYAKGHPGPIMVHVVTEKGHGYGPAENKMIDLMHSTGVIDPLTGESLTEAKRTWTDAFSEIIVEMGHEFPDIVAMTAAMADPTGLVPFSKEFPERFVDVGIAEQHAVASASGLALGGMHPYVAVYATFLNRAFDQLLMDVALLGLPVTVVLDRAGITGNDGASHNGVWDLSLCSMIPGIRIGAPRDEARLRELLYESHEIAGPSVVRYPKGKAPEDVEALSRTDDGVDILTSIDGAEDAKSVLLIGVGTAVHAATTMATNLSAEGYGVTAIDPRWVAPVAPSILALAAEHDVVVTIEDGGIHGGIGSLISEAMDAAGVETPLHRFGVPQKFLEHASREELLRELDLETSSMTEEVLSYLINS
ncbi:MAG: 1-deoxy-D-xylulose-5-phosphate synthase [Corynebacterium sp.]|nr:1-deoxy-D-xylulose-5-phosphate synthase [Corynebacterium sp.]